jgi:hypothetical protein
LYFIACLVVENSEKITETSSACFSGLVTWNSEENHVDLDRELDTITDCAPPGEEARGGKSLLRLEARGGKSLLRLEARGGKSLLRLEARGAKSLLRLEARRGKSLFKLEAR